MKSQNSDSFKSYDHLSMKKRSKFLSDQKLVIHFENFYSKTLFTSMSFLHFLLYFVLSIVLLAALFVLYRITRNYRPMLHFNPSGKVAHLVAATKSLHKPYRPTWWLLNCHIHTVRGMRYRRKSRMTNSVRRELIKYTDGGTSALDWFETDDMKEDTPILVIIHTCAGGTREPCTNNLAEAGVKKGWRVVVANNRYCSGAPITTAQMVIIRDTDDLELVIRHIRSEFKPKHMFMVGFSLGAYQTVQYGALVGDLDAIALVSHTYNPVEAEKVLHWPIQSRLYQPVIMAKLTHFAKKSPFINNPIAENAKTMAEFDQAIYCEQFGFKTAEELYKTIEVYDKIPKLKVPSLFIGADDDPFTCKKFMPIKEIEKSDNAVLVHYPEGGHVSFLTGNDGNISIVDQIVPEWFESVINDKNNQ
ncbi:Clan SC, family S33, methylesterase-like serine peptidase [Tritrichomonas foetus]|uniref:Clan SC, family S33, methylesterase-like serine peptidase n=1 Tax=Tritrichomonas foetus TaxID=1144522 RepID=A0A1J4KKI3_9EUKA|nr:Clan SC, family S33, methylesterase-like serine peptidase [Tritrichomonas foetus]|eukprot:OHT11807.1 Clan SC, family S33, methylesterase-like serine peptidase [Tritrichomonas foetus]